MVNIYNVYTLIILFLPSNVQFNIYFECINSYFYIFTYLCYMIYCYYYNILSPKLFIFNCNKLLIKKNI